MVAVTRPLVDLLADATDPAHWLSTLKDLSPSSKKLVEKAFFHAQVAYQGHTLPPTHEPLFAHAVGAAAIVAELNLLPDAIAATLLFALPDVQAEAEAWIAAECNPTVTQLVVGISRVRQIQAFGRTHDSATPEARHQQIEAMRQMILAMVEDIRVVLIKLAWRTQTMHHLARVPNEAIRREVAQETLDIFAPLANRLGVWQIKWELEDLAFRHLEPVTYKKIAKLLDERRLDRLNYIEAVLVVLRQTLAASELQADIAGRPKHIFSIWKKMQKKHLDFSELYDIRAVRILVNTVKDCYAVLGLVHSLWQPVPGEFDDYISHPKGNDYKSLHTAVIGPEDKFIEVQIRTFDMHEHAEFGVAAHWRYKEGGKGDAAYEEKIAWLRQLLDWREDVATPEAETLADAFQTELFSDTIYVMTPAGKVLPLPTGATPIDFAYAVHTDLGHRCRGAKVDGHIVALSTPLANGQRVEILSVKEGHPSINWLHDGWVKSHRATSKIRQWIRQENGGGAIEVGRAIFEREHARAGGQPNLDELASRLGLRDMDEVYANLGHGELSSKALLHALSKAQPPQALLPTEPTAILRRSRATHDAGGILVDGVDRLLTVLAKCCRPAPPDAIMGFVTHGRGISIHRANCLTLKRVSSRAPERLITADWGRQDASLFSVEIEVQARERPGLLRALSDVLARDKLGVTAITTQQRDAHARFRLTVEVRDTADIQRAIFHLMEVRGVVEARRV